MSLLYHELQRKAVHITGSLIPVGYYFVTKETALILLLFVNAILLPVEWLRLGGKIRIPRTLLRPHEEKKVAAYIYFQMAALLSILVFDKTIAIAALLMLAFGDTASGLAGAMISGGNIRSNGARYRVKPIPIMAVMYLVCLLAGLVLLSFPPAPDMTSMSLGVYAAGAAGAMLGDAVPVRVGDKHVDDNLMIPILAGAFMTAAVFI